jgi:glycosyltransferase involved in cell wall biosynthesis
MITFIIPTVARPTLLRALQSLVAQTVLDWKAIVVFDNVKPDFDLVDDDRITYLFTPTKLGVFHQHGQGGAVRNYGIRRANSSWLAFLDDDDSLTNDYVEHFYRHTHENELDFLVFRMVKQGTIYPHPDYTNQLEECNVGISFCVRRKYLEDRNIWFNNGDTEDFHIIRSIRDSGARYIIAKEVVYLVNR